MVQYQISGTGAAEVARSVERAIAGGSLLPGESLPPIRSLASAEGLSPTTVAAAYRMLRERGIVTAHGRAGTKVAFRPPVASRGAAPVSAGLVDLVAGSPDPALLPKLKPVLSRIEAERAGYPGRMNLPELVDAARERFAADGIPADRIAVTGGAMDAIERILTARLRPGDRVAVEDPGYPAVLDLVGALGLAAVPVRVDTAGLVPEVLDRALTSGVQALVVTPRAQNPTGAALTPRRRSQLRVVLKGHPEVLLIEDDHAGPVAGADLVTLCSGSLAHWAAVRSVSKSLGPDLRLAVVTGDEQTISRLEGRQRLGTGWVSTILQRTVATLWRDPKVDAAVERAAATYAARRRGLIAALAAHGIEATGHSGLNVWIPVPAEADTVRLLAERGWAVGAGERFRLQSPPAIRVTVAGLRQADAEAFAGDLAWVLGDRSPAFYA